MADRTRFQRTSRVLLGLACCLGWMGYSAEGVGQTQTQKPNAQRVAKPPSLSDEDLAGLGIRKLVGKYLTLYTDLPAAADIDELPRVFDAAIPYWCEYFHVPMAKVAKWMIVGYLIQDKDRFLRAKLIPSDLPSFLHGYQRGAELWFYEKSFAYYRRHLLLHEGTHAFMASFLRGGGPPWYMEGIAELLATHQWVDSRLTMNYFPQRKDEVEGWGRIKIVRDAVRQGQAKRLEEILQYDTRAHMQVEPYGWCWAATAFFDGHPAYQRRFRDMQKHVRDSGPEFAERFSESLRPDWRHITREWQVFISRLDYGYDVGREAIARKAVVELPSGGAEVTVAADHGWQSTGFRLIAGSKYRFEAQGRYQLATQPKIWWCEPNGVTIRYCEGRPLGVLLGAIVDEDDKDENSNGLVTPAMLGSQFETTLRRSGTLYLRINDFPSELADNQGEVKVKITVSP